MSEPRQRDAASSSSLPPEPEIACFVRRALEVLRNEAPIVYMQMSAELGRRAVTLLVDGQAVYARAWVFRVDLPTRLTSPEVSLRTTSRSILDVLNAHTTLEQAVARGTVQLVGSTSDLAACYHALLTFARGAVRCPSFPALLDEFREFVARVG